MRTNLSEFGDSARFIKKLCSPISGTLLGVPFVALINIINVCQTLRVLKLKLLFPFNSIKALSKFKTAVKRVLIPSDQQISIFESAFKKVLI